MNNLIYLILFAAVIAIAFSCKCTKNKKDDNSQNQTSPNTVLPDSIYRFTVSFISIGSGTDRTARQQFSQFIETFSKENNVKINTEMTNWGREGEIDYCLKLSELNNKQQEKFIADTKELLKKSELVRYYENSICRRKRK
jgi:hypothetical protein